MDGIDLDRELEPLFEEKSSRVSRTPEVRDVELVADRKDPSKGFITIRVQGLLSEDRIALGRALDVALSTWRSVHAAIARREEQLNPDGKTDLFGQAYAEGQSKAEGDLWLGKATQNTLKVAREICALGVVGWKPGQLRHRGQSIDFAQEEQLILSRPRQGLSTLALSWLETGTFSIELARQILRVSDAEDVSTKEQQWGKKEAPKTDNPLADAGPVESPPT